MRRRSAGVQRVSLVPSGPAARQEYRYSIPLPEILSEGTEDGYNRSFVGYLPEGQVPVADLEGMLDWNKILGRQFMTPQQLEEYRKKYIRRA